MARARLREASRARRPSSSQYWSSSSPVAGSVSFGADMVALLGAGWTLLLTDYDCLPGRALHLQSGSGGRAPSAAAVGRAGNPWVIVSAPSPPYKAPAPIFVRSVQYRR